MSPDYAQIARALRRCTFVHAAMFSERDFNFVRDLDAMRYNEQAKPLTTEQTKTLRSLAQKYRRQLAAEIVALAATLEPKE